MLYSGGWHYILVLVQDQVALPPIQFPANVPGKQPKKIQVAGPLQPCGEGTSKCKISLPSRPHSVMLPFA